MTPELVSAEVEAAYGDWSGRAVPHLTDLVPLAIGEGIDGDADLAFIATIADGHVRCGLVCGCSLLVGASMRWALNLYFDGDQDRAEIPCSISAIMPPKISGMAGLFLAVFAATMSDGAASAKSGYLRSMNGSRMCAAISTERQ